MTKLLAIETGKFTAYTFAYNFLFTVLMLWVYEGVANVPWFAKAASDGLLGATILTAIICLGATSCLVFTWLTGYRIRIERVR